MINASCIGKWCPDSLKAMNVVGFGIRAGVIPYIPATNKKDGQILLGIKKGKYTDFGGGCKTHRGEKPFDCAQREFGEESLGVIRLNPLNITHIFVTGSKAPHQIILLIAVAPEDIDEVEESFLNARKMVRKSELNSIKVLSNKEFKRVNKDSLAESLYKVRHIIERILQRKN